MTRHLDTLARLRARDQEAGRFVLPLDRAWADKAYAAYDNLRRAETVLADPEDPDSQRRINDAQAEVDRIVKEAGNEVVVFRFRRLGRATYDTLVSRHPPTEEQKAEDAAKPDRERRVWNADTFGPALLQVGMFDPKLSLGEIIELINGPDLDEVADPESDVKPLLSKAEAETLLNTAIMAALKTPPTMPEGLRLP